MKNKKTLDDYFADAKNNRKQRENNSELKIIRNNKEYPAFIVNAFLNEEKTAVVVRFVIYNSSIGTEREVKFRIDSGARYYYEEMCEMIGTDGNPDDLIGKAVFLHLEKNERFQNVKIDARISRKELREIIAEMENEEEAVEEKCNEREVSKKKRKKSSENTQAKRKTVEYELDDDLSDFN